MYSNDPCDMSRFTCTMPHFDVNGNWQYDDCGLGMKDYDTWMKLRESTVWHDTEVSDQSPYVHKYWDNYHGVSKSMQDAYWTESWSATASRQEARFSDYYNFDCKSKECQWVECEDHEHLSDGRDCWKELCTGCNKEVCQLWHWDEYRHDWTTDDCEQEYVYTSTPTTTEVVVEMSQDDMMVMDGIQQIG